MKESSRVGLTLATMVALAILLNGVARAQTPQPNPASQVAVTSFGLTPRPMPPWFRFLPKPVINAWVVNHNERDMTLHAWTLWGAVTSPTGAATAFASSSKCGFWEARSARENPNQNPVHTGTNASTGISQASAANFPPNKMRSMGFANIPKTRA